MVHSTKMKGNKTTFEVVKKLSEIKIKHRKVIIDRLKASAAK